MKNEGKNKSDSAITVFKIRDKKTGLFSNPNSSTRWSKKGKIWTSRAALSLHLGCAEWQYKHGDYEIVEIVTREVQSIPYAEYEVERKHKRSIREAEEKLRIERSMMAQEEERLKRIADLEAELKNLKGEK